MGLAIGHQSLTIRIHTRLMILCLALQHLVGIVLILLGLVHLSAA